MEKEKCIKLDDRSRELIRECISLQASLLVAPLTYMQLSVNMAMPLIASASLIFAATMVIYTIVKNEIIATLYLIIMVVAFVIVTYRATKPIREVTNYAKELNITRRSIKRRCINIVAKLEEEKLCENDRELIELLKEIMK